MARNQRKVGEGKSEVVAAIPAACSDESAAVAFLEKQRWGGEAYCPKCGSVAVYQMTDSKTGGRQAGYRWRCRDCKQQFTVRTGTVLEDSRVPLRHWCYAFWRAATSNKGVSALEIHRHTGLSYKTALFLMHRIRYAMQDGPDDGSPLSGAVEVVETYVGGKPRKGGPRKRADGTRPERRKAKSGRGTNKQPVVAMVERGGRVRASVVADVTAATLKAEIDKNIDAASRIVTDENNAYNGLAASYAGHDTVQHSAGEYACGDVNTNTIEGFFALLKRGVYGTYHNVSKKHLHRYLAEFGFRYNGRKLEDGQRTAALVQSARGKRLAYRQQVG